MVAFYSCIADMFEDSTHNTTEHSGPYSFFITHLRPACGKRQLLAANWALKHKPVYKVSHPDAIHLASQN